MVKKVKKILKPKVFKPFGKKKNWVFSPPFHPKKNFGVGKKKKNTKRGFFGKLKIKSLKKKKKKDFFRKKKKNFS